MTFLGLLRQIDTELVFFHIGVSQVCQPSRNRPNRKDDPQKTTPECFLVSNSTGCYKVKIYLSFGKIEYLFYGKNSSPSEEGNMHFLYPS